MMNEILKLIVEGVQRIIVSCEYYQKEYPQDYEGSPIQVLHDNLKATLDEYQHGCDNNR